MNQPFKARRVLDLLFTGHLTHRIAMVGPNKVKGQNARDEKKRRASNKEAETTTSSKRAKKDHPATGTGSAEAPVTLSPSKIITPKKSVLNLQDVSAKVAPETYINPTARKLFGEVEVNQSHVLS